MKRISLFLLLFCSLIVVANAQQSELVGKWQLSKVLADGKTYENLKAIYIFEEGGSLKAARSAQSAIIDAGSWEFSKKQNAIIMSSTLDNDFNGKAAIVKISKSELVYKKDEATLHFKRLVAADLQPEARAEEPVNFPPRLTFVEAEFFTEDGEYKHYDDEEKLPWRDIDKMLIRMASVKQLVYKFSKLDGDATVFTEQTLTAHVNSNPEEQALSIDYIFHGFDRYNLPDDVALQPNNEYSNLLYPEEEDTFRVAGIEQVTTPAGTFDCTVVEVAGRFETRKKLWMINSKPGIYARIITDKPGKFGQYSVFELLEIKMKK